MIYWLSQNQQVPNHGYTEAEKDEDFRLQIPWGDTALIPLQLNIGVLQIRSLEEGIWF